MTDTSNRHPSPNPDALRVDHLDEATVGAYTAALDRLSFSSDAKARMAARLSAAATPQGRQQATATAPHLTVVEPSRARDTTKSTAPAAKPRRTARRRRWVRAAAVVAAVVLGLGGGTIAVATGVLPNPAHVLSDIFGTAPAETELIDGIGHPIGSSATSNGITVTADAVIGDRYNYTVVFSIARDDGKPFEGVTANDSGKLNLIADFDFSIDGVWAAGGASYFYDADPSDNAIQLVQQMHTDTAQDEGIIGRTARFSLSGVRLWEDDAYVTIAEGSWDLKFKMNYTDSSIDLPAGQTTTHEGATVTVDGIVVSSLGVTVDYTIDQQIGDLGASGKLSDEAEARQNAVLGVPIVVTFADGSTFDATDYASSTATAQSDGTTKVHKGCSFDRIVDTASIVSVAIGDEVVPVA